MRQKNGRLIFVPDFDLLAQQGNHFHLHSHDANAAPLTEGMFLQLLKNWAVKICADRLPSRGRGR